MNLHLDVCFFVVLVLILNLANLKYLLVEVEGAEENNVRAARNDGKGTSGDVSRHAMMSSMIHENQNGGFSQRVTCINISFCLFKIT